jgi:CDP-glycerol glycerophosphotransferase (TagB/SpsB family)
MRSGTILIKQNRDASVVYPVSSELHNLIQVWHGIPFKRIGYVSADFQGMLDRIAFHHSKYRAVICSSKIDALAMTAAFYPLTFHQVWNTGLPRNDFILRSEEVLPVDFQEELTRLRGLLGDRRLVLFMPTFRNAQSEGYYRFSPEEIAWLDEWLQTNNCVLGVREHMADSARLYSAQLAGLPVLDLSDQQFANVEILYRVSSALITDYSSAFIDYMLTGKPAVSFAYDYEFYLLERGGFYDLDLIFPGPICKNFAELQGALQQLFNAQMDESYRFKRRLFFDHVDDNNSARVAEKIRDLTALHGIGKWPGEHAA